MAPTDRQPNSQGSGIQFVESNLISDLLFIQKTDMVSIDPPAYKPYTQNLEEWISYYQSKIDAGMTVPNVLNKALNHMASPAAEFLKQAFRANADFKQRTQFNRFMNRVRKTFQIECCTPNSRTI